MPNPKIPEQIVIHLGAPESDAMNVTESFADYIKNVASSEIFPTWPEQALRANILAQISVALNRVYTEFYRSRGYDFDITNSTAYDQYFVFGRSIFHNISRIVDEIFNNYSDALYNDERYTSVALYGGYDALTIGRFVRKCHNSYLEDMKQWEAEWKAKHPEHAEETHEEVSDDDDR